MADRSTAGLAAGTGGGARADGPGNVRGVAGVARRRSRWALAAALLVLLSSAACGGGMFYNTMDYGTTPGTDYLTVTATSGGVSRSLPLTLVVRWGA